MIVFQATMCGILLILQCKDCTCELGNLKEKLVGLLKNRGPDNQNSVQFTSENGMKFYMHASLLWLRGSEPKIQPIVKDENFLLWNGDLFNIDLHEGLSDTEYISNKLSNACDKKSIRQTFAELNGPGAYVYYNQNLETIWFGRDFFGRHSLLTSIKSCCVIISSIGFMNSELVEVPALGVYELSIETFSLDLKPWANRKPNEIKLPFEANLCFHKCLTPTVKSVRTDPTNSLEYANLDDYMNCQIAQTAINDLRKTLLLSVKERVSAQPMFCKNCIGRRLSKHDPEFVKDCSNCKTAVLFSGGLDSTVLVYLAALSVRQGEQIDLINVAFQQADGSYAVPDRLTAFQAFEELQELVCPLKVILNLILVNVTKNELKEWREAQIKDLLWPLDTVLDDRYIFLFELCVIVLRLFLKF